MLRAQYNKMRATIGEKRMFLAEFEGLKMCCVMLTSCLDHTCVFSGLQAQKITWLSTEMVGGKTIAFESKPPGRAAKEKKQTEQKRNRK